MRAVEAVRAREQAPAAPARVQHQPALVHLPGGAGLQFAPALAPAYRGQGAEAAEPARLQLEAAVRRRLPARAHARLPRRTAREAALRIATLQQRLEDHEAFRI